MLAQVAVQQFWFGLRQVNDDQPIQRVGELRVYIETQELSTELQVLS